jgi:hypothetical protein
VELHVHNTRRSCARIISSYAKCVKLYDKIRQIAHAVTLVLIVTVEINGRIKCVIR